MAGAAMFVPLSGLAIRPSCCFKTPKLKTCSALNDGSKSNLTTREDWIAENFELIRASPVVIGIASFGFTLLNRTLSGVPPVAEGSSSQSRADVLVVALSATVLLTGLVWISIQPKRFKPVELEGVECMRFGAASSETKRELIWTWEALRKTTCSKAMVVVYKSSCVFQAGLAAESVDKPGEAMEVDAVSLSQGSLCSTSVLASRKQSYLANLSLYPGRFELPFLPSNTQVVVIQPLGDNGVLIVAGDRIRGFATSDRAWITTLGEKLDVTLERSFSAQECEDIRRARSPLLMTCTSFLN